MPWRCPACHEPIGHSASEDLPRPGVRYRCHICRLELIVDERAEALTVAPFPPATAHDQRPPGGKRRRRKS